MPSLLSAYTKPSPVADVAPVAAITGEGEVARILSLPRRALASADDARAALASLARHDTECECKSKFRRACCGGLRDVQALALHEIRQYGGLLGPIGVGHGKSLMNLLAPMVVPDCKVALLLVPAKLRGKTLEIDVPFYEQHWTLPNVAGGRWLWPGRPTLHVISYEELSRAKAADFLEKVKPDTIILDEAHALKNHRATRTVRFLRFLRKHPGTRLLAWSGTLTSRSIKDYAHLAQFALGERTPLPRHWPTLDSWSAVIDPGSWFPHPPGDLLQLCADGETVRQGFARRLAETPGVVVSGDSNHCQATLTISERPFSCPPKVKEEVRRLAETAERPDGECLVEATQVAECARQLSCGFFYRWDYPRKEPKPLITEWLNTRKEWHRELRKKLERPAPHMDSPLLLAQAASRWLDGYAYIDPESRKRYEIPPRTSGGPRPTWQAAWWAPWRAIREKVEPVTVPVWFDDTLVQDAAEWLREGPGLAWYEFDALGRALAAVDPSFIFVGPGVEGAHTADHLTGSERVVLSIAAHGTGRDLQVHNRNLVLTPPSGGAIWEQLAGRTHRFGQQSDEVTIETYRHTEAFRTAVETARELGSYIQDSLGVQQKIISVANWTF